MDKQLSDNLNTSVLALMQAWEQRLASLEASSNTLKLLCGGLHAQVPGLETSLRSLASQLSAFASAFEGHATKADLDTIWAVVEHNSELVNSFLTELEQLRAQGPMNRNP